MKDLVKARAEQENAQLVNLGEAPSLSASRLRLGHLSKALQQRLDLVDSVCQEERLDQRGETASLSEAVFLLAEPREDLAWGWGFRVEG